MNTSAITWGDTVTIRQGVPERFRSGARAFVCGIRTIESEEESAAAGYPVGTVMYIVEYLDGSSIEVAQRFVEKARDA